MGRTRLGLLILAAAFVRPAASAAQEGYRFQITPFVGRTAFSSDLTDVFFLQDESGNPVVFDDAELESSFSIGLHAGVGRGPFAFEGTFGYIPTEFSGHSDFEAVSFDTNVLLYGGSFLYTFENPHGVEPYLLLGAGAKHYDPDVEGGDSVTDFTTDVGFGVAIPLPYDLGLRLEMRDYISSFDPDIEGVDSRKQHDLLLSAGIQITFGSSGEPEPAPGTPEAAEEQECGTQTTVTSTTMDGVVVTLEDGSVWEIDEVDRRRTMLWLPGRAVVPCDKMLVDPSSGVAVEAKELK
jgi:hypothetical protein